MQAVKELPWPFLPPTSPCAFVCSPIAHDIGASNIARPNTGIKVVLPSLPPVLYSDSTLPPPLPYSYCTFNTLMCFPLVHANRQAGPARGSPAEWAISLATARAAKLGKKKKLQSVRTLSPAVESTKKVFRRRALPKPTQLTWETLLHTWAKTPVTYPSSTLPHQWQQFHPPSTPPHFTLLVNRAHAQC